MATVTPLGGPKRRDYYGELRDAVAADLTCSTEATRGKVIAARLAYLEEERKRTEEIRFAMEVGRQMRLLMAPPVEAVEAVEVKRTTWPFVVAFVASMVAIIALTTWAVM